MSDCVNNDMARQKKISEKEIADEYELLQRTSDFLNRLIRTKNSELEFVIKEMETNYSDVLARRAYSVHDEIVNLQKKINWEVKRCNEFDQKVNKWNSQKHIQFIGELSKKILNKNDKNN